jgi:hypothetical protein
MLLSDHEIEHIAATPQRRLRARAKAKGRSDTPAASTGSHTGRCVQRGSIGSDSDNDAGGDTEGAYTGNVEGPCEELEVRLQIDNLQQDVCGQHGRLSGRVTRSRARSMRTSLSSSAGPVGTAAPIVSASAASEAPSAGVQVAGSGSSRLGAVASNFDTNGPNLLRGDVAAVQLEQLSQYVDALSRVRGRAVVTATPAQQADRHYLDKAADLAVVSPRQECDCDGIAMHVPTAAVKHFEYYWFNGPSAWSTKAAVKRQPLRGDYTACIATNPVHLYVPRSAIPTILQHINRVCNRMHAASDNPDWLSKQPLQFSADVLFDALTAANVPDVFFEHLGS